jgi:hypothetical protein
MYEELNKYVRGEKKINLFSSYKIMSMVQHFILDEIRNMGFSEPQYKLHCVIKDNRGYDTDTLGEKILKDKKIIININRRLIDDLDTMATSKDVEEFDKENKEHFTRIDLFLVMFHELEHVHQAKMYETNTVDNMILYKDKVLSMYFNHIKDDDAYYSENYKVTSEEVLANIKAIEKTIKYFTKNNIEFTKKELEILKLKMNKYKTLLNNKQRKNPIDGKMYDLDYLYNMVLQDQTYEIGNLLEEKKRR